MGRVIEPRNDTKVARADVLVNTEGSRKAPHCLAPETRRGRRNVARPQWESPGTWEALPSPLQPGQAPPPHWGQARRSRMRGGESEHSMHEGYIARIPRDDGWTAVESEHFIVLMTQGNLTAGTLTREGSVIS